MSIEQHPPDYEPSGFSDISQFPQTTAGYVVERRKSGYHPPCGLIIEVQERLLQGDAAIQKLQDDTAEMLDILHNAKAFFRFAKVFGRLIGFFTPLVAVYLTWRGLAK